MFLPPTGGTDSVIQSQILFEELVRVKSMEVEAAGAESGPNYIKELLMDRYGRDLVVGFLTVSAGRLGNSYSELFPFASPARQS